MQQLEFRAMNCQMLALVECELPEAGAMLAEVPAWFAEWEQTLSRFRIDSELSQLNRQSGQAVAVSETLFCVLDAAYQAAIHTNGLVSPMLLSALEQAGYDRSFELLSNEDSAGSSPMDATIADWRAIKLDSATQRVYLPPAARLDLGGIAKGWAASQAAQRLAPWGAALVDAGGDIAMCGQRKHGAPWRIEVANPWHSDEPLAFLEVGQGGVATSGRDVRRWQRNGVWQHHILDPRSGQPAQSDLFCATIVAPSPVLAESAAKVALILGSQKGLEWIEEQTTLGALFVLEDGTLLTNARMDRVLCR